MTFSNEIVLELFPADWLDWAAGGCLRFRRV